MADEAAVTDNPGKHRYETPIGDAVAFLTYNDDPDGARVFVHTEVPPAFEGRGIGGRLVKTALDDARRDGRRVVPKCPFVRSYIERHPEYADLVR
jgi:predicted GNAT family acetyltransferase